MTVDSCLCYLHAQQQAIEADLAEALHNGNWKGIQTQVSVVSTERADPPPHILIGFNLDSRTIRNRGYATGKKDLMGMPMLYPPFRQKEKSKVLALISRLMSTKSLLWSYNVNPKEYEPDAYLEFKIVVTSKVVENKITRT